MHEKTLAGLSQALHSKAISSVELTELYLKRIEQFDGALNSYITVTPELALEQARAADARLAAGDAGPLTGIPLAHKDLFCTQGVRTSCGSKMLDNFIAPYESSVTARLLAAGTVTLGKTNMDEFAMGSSNESSYYGAVRNPWNTEHVPGGSSGAPVRGGHRHRYRRLDSPAGGLHRVDRPQADLWPGLALGHDCLRLQP
ncbi:amidase [Pseudomonas saudimassiliensis]|uniref:Amidase n=1 Tax=Pseudomonas saudimassiliensis TaxID=1461581 RepID=A0A078M2J8_9PSED|nr:amidase [Pseudomonas saudimassiliensis]CEF25144.1 amidase [Pseudomonas saudimassiliensis]